MSKYLREADISVQIILYHFIPQRSCDFMLYIQEVFTVIGNTLIRLGLTSSLWAFYLSDGPLVQC